jgi:GNAT superfamily N-acetyltransferase
MLTIEYRGWLVAGLAQLVSVANTDAASGFAADSRFQMSEPATVTASYPREHETDVVIRDGSTVHVRPIRADDGPAIRVFLEAISADSIAFRFFGTPDLDWVVSWSLDVDYADRFALIAESGTPARIVAHAVYIRIDDERAEVAFLVADAWQGRGISTIMLAHLGAARHHHVHRRGVLGQSPEDRGVPGERLSDRYALYA